MPSPRTSTLRSYTAGALLAAALLTPAAADPPEITSLAGQLLIASPNIGDPRFAHTVILMVKHDKDGALGITINRPVGEKSIASLLEAPGEDISDIEGTLASSPVVPCNRSSALSCTAPNTGATRLSRSTNVWR
jgi:hypothetical protein